MEELFTHRLRTAGGRAGRAWVWVRGAIDVIEQAVREWAAWAVVHATGRNGTMRTLWQDMRESARTLRAAPLFTAAAVATLALGVGAASATFSVVHAVLLKDLPYEEPDRLVVVWPEQNYNISMVEMTADAVPALEDVTGISMWRLTLTGEGEPQELDAVFVSPGHFDVLGVRPALGRGFLPEEGRQGAGGVAVLSHEAWVRLFGADPSILGRVVAIAGSNHTQRQIIGVMPRGFRAVRGDPDLWAPLERPDASSLTDDETWYVNWRVGRLATDASLEAAREQVRAFARSAREQAPRIIDEEEVREASVEPLSVYTAGALRPTLWVALGAVSLVLLIACANVANLLLARGEARTQDLAVRVALGAGRERVVRMLLAESAVIGALGGALGVTLSFGLVRIVVSRAPETFPRLDEIAVSGPVLLFALAATFGATLVAAIVPALRGSRVDALGSLGRSARTSAGRRGSRLTTALVAGQVALAAVVAVGSGLMLRSLERLLAVDPGVDGAGVLTFRANPGETRYERPAFVTFYGALLERLRGLPGVESAGAIHILPGTVNNWSFPTFPEGITHPEGSATPSTNFRAVWPGYFETVRIPVLRGRAVTDADGPDDEPVVVVNQAFAERWWPGQDPLGKTVRLFTPDATAHRVVGVVGDVRQHARDRVPRPELYYAQRQWPWAVGQTLVVRYEAGTDPMSHAGEVRRAVWSLDADVPVTEVQALDTVLDGSTRTLAFLTLLLSAFGALSVALGAVGVFGVTAYTVGRRIPEFGVRLALGSPRPAVVRSAVARSLGPVGGGLLVGLVAAWVSSGLLESTLYDVVPTDPVTFAGVALLLAGVGLVASLLPAWRAGRVDPVSVLSRE
ncbi:MAG TPA: ABC transporter permease [Longimicrobiales bacterium]|nr:ABC transporter permease [Longimicrobiales bacterium]